MSTAESTDIKRRVLAGAIGVICDIEGAVHVHLADDLDLGAAATADVLLEVAAARDRQRAESGGSDEERSDADWRELHVDHLLRAFPKRRGCNKLASRDHLVQAMAALSAHLEAIDRGSGAEGDDS